MLLVPFSGCPRRARVFRCSLSLPHLMFATTASCGTIVAIVALILDSERFLEFLLMSTLRQLIMASAPAPPPPKKRAEFPCGLEQGEQGDSIDCCPATCCPWLGCILLYSASCFTFRERIMLVLEAHSASDSDLHSPVVMGPSLMRFLNQVRFLVKCIFHFLE